MKHGKILGFRINDVSVQNIRLDKNQWGPPIGLPVGDALAERFASGVGKNRYQWHYRRAEGKCRCNDCFPRRKLSVQRTEITIQCTSCARSITMLISASIHVLNMDMHCGYQRDANHRRDYAQRNRTQ